MMAFNTDGSHGLVTCAENPAASLRSTICFPFHNPLSAIPLTGDKACSARTLADFRCHQAGQCR